MFTHEALRALGMSAIAGFSTLLGALIIFFAKGKSQKLVTASLGFAAGVMISVCFTDLMPNAQSELAAFSGKRAGIVFSVLALIAGLLISAGLDLLVPHEKKAEDDERRHTNLFRTGFVSMLAITLHNFPEGIATFMASYENITLGASLTLAIALHNIPEGISVAMPVYFSTGSKVKAFKYTFISGVSEPIGALLAFFILRPFINGAVMGTLFGIVSGIMLYIAIEELIPSSRQYGHTKIALVATFAGICLMPLTHAI